MQRVKELYENTKDLYELVKKRRTMFTRYLELRDNANNPDKFKNRGGRLLREQTERKMLQKEIPKVKYSYMLTCRLFVCLFVYLFVCLFVCLYFIYFQHHYYHTVNISKRHHS